MYGEMPGEIIEFDPATQKAMIQPLYKPRHSDGNGGFVEVELPVLEEVPVRFDRCLKGRLTYMLEPGDRVQLRPQFRNTERFHTEDIHIANDIRSYSLSDMEAYMDGGESLINPIQQFDDQHVHLGFDGETGMYGVRGRINGTMRVDLAPGELLDVLAQLAEACASNTTLVSSGSSSGTHAHTSVTQFATIAATLRAMISPARGGCVMAHKSIALKANENDIQDIFLEDDGNLALVFDAEAVWPTRPTTNDDIQRRMVFKFECWCSLAGRYYGQKIRPRIGRGVNKSDGEKKPMVWRQSHRFQSVFTTNDGNWRHRPFRFQPFMTRLFNYERLWRFINGVFTQTVGSNIEGNRIG